jgi:hypothetical protein
MGSWWGAAEFELSVSVRRWVDEGRMMLGVMMCALATGLLEEKGAADKK